MKCAGCSIPFTKRSESQAKKAGRARLDYSLIDGISIFKDQVKGKTMRLRKATFDGVC